MLQRSAAPVSRARPLDRRHPLPVERSGRAVVRVSGPFRSDRLADRARLGRQPTGLLRRQRPGPGRPRHRHGMGDCATCRPPSLGCCHRRRRPDPRPRGDDQLGPARHGADRRRHAGVGTPLPDPRWHPAGTRHRREALSTVRPRSVARPLRPRRSHARVHADPGRDRRGVGRRQPAGRRVRVRGVERVLPLQRRPGGGVRVAVVRPRAAGRRLTRRAC